MTTPYTFIPDLGEVGPPAAGIQHRVVYADDRVKAVVLGFAAGEELREHTAAAPVVIHLLSGEATWTIGSDRHTVRPGAWAHMPARLPHSVRAETPVVMLLLLLKGGPAA